VVRLLSTKISSIACANAQGDTALMLAARGGHLTVATLLMELGAHLEAKNKAGTTPLLASVEGNKPIMFAFLLEQRANVNALDNNRNCSLHVAAATGLGHIVLIAMRAGAETNVLNGKDETPLEVAKNADICRSILGNAYRACVCV
jgi:ankyrin repeat protein